MKILYITAQPIMVNTSANLRNIALIRGLKELGHEVHVLNMDVTKEAAGYDETLKIHLEDVPINYINTIKLHNNMVVKNKSKKSVFHSIKEITRYVYRSFAIFDSLALSIKNVKKYNPSEDKYDLMISSSDLKSSHLIAKELIKLFPDKFDKWVQYWGDPLTIDINNKSKSPRWLIKRTEERLLDGANKIIYVSPFTLEAQRRLFPNLYSNMDFVPIAYIEPKITASSRLNNMPIKVGYFGDYTSTTRDILPLYEAAKKSPVILDITGNSDITLESTQNININQRLPYKIVQNMEEECDVLVCILNKTGTQIPGKIYHYAAFDKPVIVIKNKEMNIEEYLSKYDKYRSKYIYCNNDVESIQDVFSKLNERWNDISSEPLESFSPKEIASVFLNTTEG